MILIVSSFFYIPTYKYFYDSARYISAQSYVAEPIILYIIYTLLYPVHYLYILYLRHRGIYLPHEPPNARALSKVHCRNSHEYCSIAALDVSLMHTHTHTHTRSLSLSLALSETVLFALQTRRKAASNNFGSSSLAAVATLRVRACHYFVQNKYDFSSSSPD